MGCELEKHWSSSKGTSSCEDPITMLVRPLNSNFISCSSTYIVSPQHPKIMDAVRMGDQLVVAFKKVEKDSSETAFLRHLNNSLLKTDPRNRAVPLLDVIEGE